METGLLCTVTAAYVVSMPVVVRDASASDVLSLDRYESMRAGQRELQPAPNALVPVEGAPAFPALPPLAPKAAGPAPAGAVNK